MNSLEQVRCNTAWQLLEERVGGSTAAAAQYIWGVRYIDELVLRDRDTNDDGALDERLYALQDANWNVTALADASGAVVERYRYTPYGTPTIYTADWTADRPASLVHNTVLYTGRRLDPETGLQENRHRWLAPHLGLWSNRDPAKADPNLYRYVFNTPVNATDPTGLVIYALKSSKLGSVLATYVGADGFKSRDEGRGWCKFYNEKGPDLLSIAGTWGSLEKEIVGGMLAEGREFRIHGNKAGDRLRMHVAERVSIVNAAKNSPFTYGGTDANPAFWDASLNTIGSASAALQDAIGGTYSYVLGCHDAIYMLMLGGMLGAHGGNASYMKWFDSKVGKNPIGNQALLLDVQIANRNNWIPGDRGYITNTDPRSNGIGGLEGHNMIYVGVGKFHGAFSGDPLQTLDQAIDYVRHYTHGAGVAEPRVEETRRFPKLSGPLP